jgi:hypothetical protein
LTVSRELGGVNVIEGLDHLRPGEVRLQELRGRRRLVVEVRDVTVPLRIVVVGVDDDLRGRGERPGFRSGPLR